MNLKDIVDSIANNCFKVYDCTLMASAETEIVKDFPLLVFEELGKTDISSLSSYFSNLSPFSFSIKKNKINGFAINDDIDIPRFFILKSDYDNYCASDSKESSRYHTTRTFTINRNDYYLSSQWMGHDVVKKNNLRINAFAYSLYFYTDGKYFVKFIPQSSGKYKNQLWRVDSIKNGVVKNAPNSVSSTISNIPKPIKNFSYNPILSAIRSTNLIYSDDLIIRYAYSLMTKPFAILSGLAGSGKTQLAIALAHSLSEDIEKQVCLVPVGADWTNREPLLGYPNALKSNEYATPENGVLDFIIRAGKNPQKPYFLILDEMNLSYVERYFADFLSVMESGKEIPLWENGNDEVPASIKLPKNLYITGTINVDETTYMFSPKVLDRANVIEFKVTEDDMVEFLKQNPEVNICNANGQAASIAQAFVEHGNNVTPSTIADEKIKEFFKQLKTVNAEFGYRSATEMRKFINLVLQDNALDENTVIDAAIVQKMLPKLHGSRKKLDKVLSELWKLCFDKNAPELIEDATTENAIYPLSADKILRMYKCAHDNGFTSFAEA